MILDEKLFEDFESGKAVDRVQNFLDSYGLGDFKVYERDKNWLAVDVDGFSSDDIGYLLSRLRSVGLQADLWEHYVEIYIGDKDALRYSSDYSSLMFEKPLKEDFDDILNFQLPNPEEEIVLEIPTAPEVATIPTGPKTGEEIGQSSMLLDAIAACAKTIDNYNIIKTNLTDPKMIEVVEGIASQETNILGKLQGLLKEVSPNASEIMYGATDAEAALTEDLDEEDMGFNLDSSYLEHLDPMTGKLKVEAWAPPVEQSDVNDMATANMPDMIIPDDLDVDDDFEDPEEI